MLHRMVTMRKEQLKGKINAMDSQSKGLEERSCKGEKVRRSRWLSSRY